MEEERAQTKPVKKRSKLKIIGWIIALFVLWLGMVQILAADRYEALVQVVPGESKVGVNPTTERLDFGDLSRQSSARRVITVSNNGGIPTRIFVLEFGELAELMQIEPRQLRLMPDEKQEINFTVRIPSSASDRIYKARVMILRIPFF